LYFHSRGKDIKKIIICVVYFFRGSLTKKVAIDISITSIWETVICTQGKRSLEEFKIWQMILLQLILGK
jgi:hypothetical protein